MVIMSVTRCFGFCWCTTIHDVRRDAYQWDLDAQHSEIQLLVL